MKVRTRFLPPALALAALALAPVAPNAATTPKVFTIVERAVSDTVTDTGAKDDSVGDVLTFNNEVFDATNKTPVGRSNGFCLRTVVGKTWACSSTNILKDGQIDVSGPFSDAGDTVLAVTGGTGAYANVRGDMKLHARDAKGSEYDFTFNLQ